MEDPAGGAALVALEVDQAGRLTTHPLPEVGGREQRVLPLPDGRVALVGNKVAVVPAGG